MTSTWWRRVWHLLNRRRFERDLSRADRETVAPFIPEGVGPIRDGDQVTIEIERVGRMTVPVRQGSGGYNLALRREEKT